MRNPPLIRSWLAERPRWHVHLTPTSSSWFNQVERFFALITDKKIRRGIYRSAQAPRADIMDFISHHNTDPKSFKWTKPHKSLSTNARCRDGAVCSSDEGTVMVAERRHGTVPLDWKNNRKREDSFGSSKAV